MFILYNKLYLYKKERIEMRIIAIIPARGGSKGIPRKNIKLLAGKPLVAYSIEVAIKSKYITKVFVSTDDEEIAQISKEYHGEVIKRPNGLAKDDSPTIDAVIHVLDTLQREKDSPDLIVLLQPTSPLRTVEDIDDALEIFMKNDCEAVVSSNFDPSLYLSFKIEKSYLKPFLGKKYFSMRRQDLSPLYRPNGAIYIIKPEILLKYKSFYPPKTIPYLMPKKRSIDIDDELDFLISDFLISHDSTRNNNEKDKNK